MKILVTGVSGFVGGRLAKHLAIDHEVWGIFRSTFPTQLESLPNLKLVQDDLANPQRLPEECEYVVHAAADTPLTTMDKAQLYRSNLDGMRQLLKWCELAGVKRFLFCSTMAVYGQIEEESINEATPSRTPNDYGASKFAAELALEQWSAYQKTCRSLTVRLPGVVGREAKDTFIPRTVQKIHNEETVTVFRKKALFNNIVHVEDLAEFVTRWPQQEVDNSYLCFNVASTEPIPLSKVVETLMEGLRTKTTVTENGKGRPPFLIDTTLAQSQGFPLDSTRNSLLRYAEEVVKSRHNNL
jgi:nucleoside-diphosphate-sugar epimerase